MLSWEIRAGDDEMSNEKNLKKLHVYWLVNRENGLLSLDRWVAFHQCKLYRKARVLVAQSSRT